jgi:hypothetical protein
MQDLPKTSLGAASPPDLLGQAWLYHCQLAKLVAAASPQQALLILQDPVLDQGRRTARLGLTAKRAALEMHFFNAAKPQIQMIDEAQGIRCEEIFDLAVRDSGAKIRHHLTTWLGRMIGPEKAGQMIQRARLTF